MSILDDCSARKDQEYLQKSVLPRFHDACMRCLHEEGFFGTTNHYFDAKFLEDEICPPKLIDRFAQKARRLLKDDNGCYRQVKLDPLKQCLKEAKEEIAHELVHTDLLQNQKRRIFAAIKAHFDVEKKTFVDNLLKKTKDVLIKGHSNWIEREVLRSEAILKSATEDESVKKLRSDLVARLGRLEECMVLLRDVPLPVKTSAGKKRNADEITSG